MIISPIKNLDPEKVKYYDADSGVDIYTPVGTSIVAAGDGELVYSERGHTKWTTPPDTPNSILLRLKTPLYIGGRTYSFCWYTHLSEIAYQVPDDGQAHTIVKAGNYLGKTGTGNSVNHLHFGLLVNRAQAVESDWMAPADLAALLKSILKGTVQVPEVEQEKKNLLKIFAHDGKITLVLNEKEIPVKGINAVIEY
jgi:murein DD-endopeptidase MepM/ murein hydrolase activator NlpD